MLYEGTIDCSIIHGLLSGSSIYLMTSSFQSAAQVKGGFVPIHKSKPWTNFIQKWTSPFEIKCEDTYKFAAGKTVSEMSIAINQNTPSQ